MSTLNRKNLYQYCQGDEDPYKDITKELSEAKANSVVGLHRKLQKLHKEHAGRNIVVDRYLAELSAPKKKAA